MIAMATLFAMASVGISAALIMQGDKVRLGEEKRDDAWADEAKMHKLYWRVAHMRSDISAMTMLLALTNALLAAILGTLVMR